MLYDKNPMENTGYAAEIANLFKVRRASTCRRDPHGDHVHRRRFIWSSASMATQTRRIALMTASSPSRQVGVTPLHRALTELHSKRLDSH